MRRNFTGPFWVLLVFGLVLMLVASVYLHTFIQASGDSSGRALPPTISLLRFFMWPAIFLAEALGYWLLRRRNSFRSLSWAHCVIFVLAFLLNSLFTLILTTRSGHVPIAEARVNRQIMRHEERYFFWGLVILAHLAFVAVLANCLRKPAPVTESGGQENLLDDVVL